MAIKMTVIEVAKMVSLLLGLCALISNKISQTENSIAFQQYPRIEIDFEALHLRKKDKYFAVFLIPTLPAHVEIRKAIRETWANVSRWKELEDEEEQYTNIKLMFIAGQIQNQSYSEEFLEEADQHSDIFISKELKEHRTILKYKVLWGLQRSQQLFDYNFLIKTDDDIFVNLPTVLKGLKKMNSTKVYGGHIMHYGGFGGYPKWKYCSGGGYVLSHDMVSKIISLEPAVHNVQFRPEDGYVGWLVYKYNEKCGFSLNLPITISRALKLNKALCEENNFWFYHGMKTNTMNAMFEKINENTTTPCTSLMM